MRRPLERAATALLAAAFTWACNGAPTPPMGDELPPVPLLLSPVSGAQAPDTPTFSVRNARGFDLGEANYTFRVSNLSGSRELLAFAVPAGKGTTMATAPSPLPRGISFVWRALATHADGRELSSTTETFELPAVECLSGRDPYAKSVVDWFVPECSLRQNKYNDPDEVLGPPDAGGHGPDMFFGFMSLGDDGYVTVDMEACAQDRPGFDVRVYQAVSSEEVTLWAAGTPSGPFVLLRARKPCGKDLPGVFSNVCDFDLADAGFHEARYFKIEDGENFPCPGDTVTEGTDIDAIEVLHPKP